MRKSESLFGTLASNPNFIKDIDLLRNLTQDKLDSVLNVYLKSKYRSYYHIHLKRFSDAVDLPMEHAHTLIHMLEYFAYKIVPAYDVPDIVSALNELTSNKSDVLFTFLKNLKDKKTQEILEVLDLIDDEIGNVNPHFRNLTFNIQNRIVLKNGKVVENLPVVILQLNTSQEKNDDRKVLELLEDDLEVLINGLNAIKQKLSILKGN